MELAPASEADRAAFRQKAGILPGQRMIGMAARLATEKGVEYLVQAMPPGARSVPGRARFVCRAVPERAWRRSSTPKSWPPLIGAGRALDLLRRPLAGRAGRFFPAAEVTVLPSINSTESFGMVQVESMACGTPVVASDLPGVRVPVTLTGMGRVVPAATRARWQRPW